MVKERKLKMLKNIKGAIFDMDGTLIDSLMLWDIIWGKFGEKFLKDESFRPNKKDDKAVRTMTLRDAMDYIHSIYNIGSSGAELFETANEIMINFYSKEVKLKKGALEFLEHCYTHGVKMCIASATDISLIKIAVEHCNIKKYFLNIFSCAEIGKGKDEPDIYLKAMECLGTGIEETCIFEDSHIAIETANKIGMKTVGIYDKLN
ncbi:MAG: HAD family hydrolase, partial [Clostridia bacterium]|nr:HAD family hydrolase [Clostridia bacterium]